jgi:hypothetical protein
MNICDIANKLWLFYKGVYNLIIEIGQILKHLLTKQLAKISRINKLNFRYKNFLLNC